MSSDSVIAKTRELLARCVTKTPITDKLLARPPFRYLHDLTMEIFLSCNYAPDLFSTSEKDAASIADKDAKLAFLTKLIDRLVADSGKTVKAKPQKIVAGLDTDDTNELLQILVETASNRPAQKAESTEKLTKTKAADSTAKSSKKQADSQKSNGVSNSKTSSKNSKSSPKKEASVAKQSEKKSLEKLPSLPQIQPPTNIIEKLEPTPIRAPTVIAEAKVENAETTADDDAFIIIPSSIGVNDRVDLSSIGQSETHGGLVRKILASTVQSSSVSTDSNIAALQSSKSKDRQLVLKEIDSVREDVQNIARNVVPLSQLLDYFQEDIDSSIKEMSFWKQEHAKYSKEVDSEKSITSTELAPLKAQLLALDEQISEQISKRDALKANITENETIIAKLMANITRS